MILRNLFLSGRVIGDSYYRVGEHLWKQAETDIERTKILDQYIRKGFEFKGGYEEPFMLIKKMGIYWKKFNQYSLE